MGTPRARIAGIVVLALLLLTALAACGGDETQPTPAAPTAAAEAGHPLLGPAAEVVPSAVPALPDAGGGLAAVTVDYPRDGSVFPPEFVPPTFLWHDASEAADTWWVHVRFSQPGADALDVWVPGAPPPQGEIDPEALGETNQVYQPTPYQSSARSWTPSAALWQTIKARSREAEATVVLTGFAAATPEVPLSTGRVRLSTSRDPVGAPIFYRDVPLMPSVGETGTIQPLARNAVPLIAWRLKDVSRDDSRLLLTGMPSCANCHSFSRDGKTLGMDIDGPEGDKGAYAVAPVEASMRIDRDHVMTWNSFPDKPEGHRTIGFLSRISPDGRYVLSTVNEALYVANFADYRCLQVFYPTRGILAWRSNVTGEMRALPGADSKAYVHCSPVWTPDGETIVFARGKAKDPYDPAVPIARYPNDPNETEMRYDLYRMPFAEGAGGPRTAIVGASDNGMSNTFPKVSPDGRWVVYVRCRNGQLLRPDGRLWIVPLEGGEAREMRCNLETMNSWHSFSPNGRWMVFSSKSNTPYTQMFLTHLDEDGYDTPAILIPNATAANRAVNLPEFLNAPYDALQEIAVPAANHHVYFQRGYKLLHEGHVDEAQSLLEEAIAAEPEFSRAHASLGLVHQARGEAELAREHYEASLAVYADNARVLTNLGLLLLHEGETEKALALWRRAVQVDPYDNLAHNNLGLVLGSEGRFDEAARHFQRALEIDPEFVEGHTNLGLLALRQDRPTEARRHLEAALELDAGFSKARRALASLYEETGQPRDAIRQYEKLLQQDPDDVTARARLAWILATAPLADVRDGARALEHAKRAVELTGGRDARAFDVLAAALAEGGQLPVAVEAAERAAALADVEDRELVRGIRQRLGLYRAGRPYRAPR